MQNWKRISVTGLGAVILFTSVAALGFPQVHFWHEAAAGPRAGGASGDKNGITADIFATGGVSDWGINCSVCHVKAAGLINANVAPSGGWPKKNGLNSYVPGTTYTVVTDLIGEHLNPNAPVTPMQPVPDNVNGFALTFEDAAGKVQGVLTTDGTGAGFARSSNSATCLTKDAPFPGQQWEVQPVANYTAVQGTTFLVGDCHAIVNLSIPNRTSWTFKWKAPAAGTGQITIYYGVVDGSSHGLNSQDDDVKVGTIKLVEGP